MNKAVELLPCPFCGGEAKFYDGDTPFIDIGCGTDGCPCETANFFEYEKKGEREKAIKAWNTRATPSLEAIIAKIEALKIPHKAKNRTVEEADRFLITNQTIDKAISIIREFQTNQQKGN